MEDRAIEVSQERWNEFLLDIPTPGIFDKDALLAFAKSERNTKIYSNDDGTMRNDGLFHYVQPITFRNNATEENLSWNFHVVKRWPMGSSPDTNHPTHSIEFRSWIHPATGQECVSGFGNWGDDSDEEEKQECYSILRAFFPPPSEYDIKEPAEY